MNANLFYFATKIPTYIFDNNLNTICYYPDATSSEYSKTTLAYFKEVMATTMVKTKTPLLYASDTCFFALLKLDESTNALLGPVSPTSLSYKQFYTDNHILDSDMKDLLQLYHLTQQSPHMPLSQFANNMALLIKLETNEDIDVETILENFLPSATHSPMATKPDYFEPQYNTLLETIEFENQVCSCLSNGSVDEIKNAFKNTPLFNKLPHLISTATDYHKFLFMYSVLCYMTVLKDGVDIHKAYPILDSYISQAPSVTTAIQLKELCLQLTIDFCNQIIPIRRLTSDSPIVTKCLRYIHEHIGEKITIDNLMEHCNVSRRTITQHFANYYHMTVAEYITSVRMKEAAFLLSHSVYSISEISNQLAFSSQSHFTTAFQKTYHCTPLQYRNKINKLTLPIPPLSCYD